MNKWLTGLKEGIIMCVCCAIPYYLISGERLLHAATFGVVMGLFWGFCFFPHRKKWRRENGSSCKRS